MDSGFRYIVFRVPTTKCALDWVFYLAHFWEPDINVVVVRSGHCARGQTWPSLQLSFYVRLPGCYLADYSLRACSLANVFDLRVRARCDASHSAIRRCEICPSSPPQFASIPYSLCQSPLLRHLNYDLGPPSILPLFGSRIRVVKSLPH